jgi:hypothetical protein
MGQVFLEVLRFSLSEAFHQRSTPIVILKLFLTEWQMGEDWEPSKSNVLTKPRNIGQKSASIFRRIRKIAKSDY